MGRLAEEAFGGTLHLIEDAHVGLADRVFRYTAPANHPARALHRGIARGVYGGLRVAGTALGRAVTGTIDATVDRERGRVLARSPRGRAALAILGGAVGDRLEAELSPLAIPMTLRQADRDLPLSTRGLAAAYPESTGLLVLFVHGLTESETAWSFGALRHWGDPQTTYGRRLQAEFGWTPLYLRYNTGAHISDNGRRLADLLARVHGAWPVRVERIALVGHSMGGLVIRSAYAQAVSSDAAWVRDVRSVVTLCTPHLGAPLEQGANLLAKALGALPETHGVRDAVNVRSVGIKDLRFGHLLEEDWLGTPADRARTRGQRVEPLPWARHHVVAASLKAPLGGLLGDLLVRRKSAFGLGRGGVDLLGCGPEDQLHLRRAHHFDVLNHPEVYAHLRRWLDPDQPPQR